MNKIRLSPLYPGQIQTGNLGMIELQHPLPYISGIKKTCQENMSLLGHSDHALGLLALIIKSIVEEPIPADKINKHQTILRLDMAIQRTGFLSIVNNSTNRSFISSA